ncbi:unnamed protein product [Caenorhabditis auriculariae]|uniref:Uncharacterized protein n=1 Tax=Caenorhabditis auriculariae TaxID=2777116 RepID=A0A8S1HZK1_9PELO|nr:unnamed protein product [Caenorhabditis auriculariae]
MPFLSGCLFDETRHGGDQSVAPKTELFVVGDALPLSECHVGVCTHSPQVLCRSKLREMSTNTQPIGSNSLPSVSVAIVS